MHENPWDLPESQEAIDATEAVIEGGRKRKTFFEQHMFPLKGDSPKERLRKILFDVFALVAVGAAVFLIVWAGVLPWMHHRTMQDAIEARPVPIYGYECSVCRNPWPEDMDYCAFCAENPPEQDPEAPEHPAAGYRNIIAPRVRIGRYSFEELHDINRDVMAWLEVPGADIDLPVVQARDNDFYLYRDLHGRPSRHGNPFFDFRNRVRTTPMSTNLIIYGHHMRDGTIFSRLPRFRTADGVRRNPLITLTLENGDVHQYLIFASVIVNGRLEHDNFYMFRANTPDFPTAVNFDGFIRAIRQRSLVEVDLDVSWGDYLITLQTCIYDFPDAFLYVFGRRVRPGETASLSSGAIRNNPNPRLPQIMFDRQGRQNPFDPSDVWHPIGRSS
ncbi:MAG: class B sortase [Oscillospiraceae bacterium]|nr:class B sortase [Oscillospiraceae bacterium]